MSFVSATAYYSYGMVSYAYSLQTYCQDDTTKSDYGKCYNIITGKAVFVQTDTSTYPTLPCESDNTCTRYTSTTYTRTIATIFSYSGKQAILQYFYSRSHSNRTLPGNVMYILLLPVPTGSGTTSAYLWFLPAPHYETTAYPIYDPVGNFKLYLNPYAIPSGHVTVLRWQGNFFERSVSLAAYEGSANNLWYAFDAIIVWAYETSPLAIIALDYEREYVPYQELRRAFGYAYTGIDQPGWNADDITRVLKELFPERAWAVFDDSNLTLYLYNLTVDDVPDWLIARLSPVAIKVLKRPPDRSTALQWLEELNRRNVQEGTPAITT